LQWSAQRSLLRLVRRGRARTVDPDAKRRILVVEASSARTETIRHALSLEGYDVTLATGDHAVRVADAESPDAAVVDLPACDEDSLVVCRRIRNRHRQLPLLAMSPGDSVPDRVAGLEAGADDYLASPRTVEEILEFVARVRALLRRSESEEGVLSYADLVLDTEKRTVVRADRRIDLTRTEFGLLELLLRNPGRVIHRTEISRHVWGFDFGPSSNSLNVYVGYVRRKIEAAGEPRLIHTVRGVGYVLGDR
jgi:two-component system response regulator MprA